MEKEKRERGRPPIYSNPEELQNKIDEYFNTLEGPVTITGLVLFCGFCDRASFYDYEKKPNFSHTIKNARTRIENYYEMSLLDSKIGAAGPIFALKNFGWSDKHEHEISGPDKGPISFETTAKKLNELFFSETDN